jgi:hypothetical protein
MNYTDFNIRSSEAKEMNERKKSRDFWYRGYWYGSTKQTVFFNNLN